MVLYLDERAKKIWLGTFVGSVLAFYYFFCGSVIDNRGLVNYTADL